MTYNIYVPDDLYDCLRVLVVSSHPHSYPPPLPIKTPLQIIHCLESLLLQLNWKLADATPQWLSLDSGFIQGLQQALGWTNSKCDPLPHDLYPSLGILDHLHHLINVLQSFNFPHETGFQGILLVVSYILSFLLVLQVQNYLQVNRNASLLTINIYTVWNGMTSLAKTNSSLSFAWQHKCRHSWFSQEEFWLTHCLNMSVDGKNSR